MSTILEILHFLMIKSKNTRRASLLKQLFRNLAKQEIIFFMFEKWSSFHFVKSALFNYQTAKK